MQINELLKLGGLIPRPPIKLPTELPWPPLSPETIETIRNAGLILGFAGLGATVGGFLGLILSIDYFRAGLRDDRRDDRSAEDVFKERDPGMNFIMVASMIVGAGVGAAATALFVYSR